MCKTLGQSCKILQSHKSYTTEEAPTLVLWMERIHQVLDCSPTNRERELGLDRRETG